MPNLLLQLVLYYNIVIILYKFRFKKNKNPLQIGSLLAKTSEIYFKRDLGVQAAQLTSLLATRRGAALWYREISDLL